MRIIVTQQGKNEIKSLFFIYLFLNIGDVTFPKK